MKSHPQKSDITLNIDGFAIGISLADPKQARALIEWMKARREVVKAGVKR